MLCILVTQHNGSQLQQQFSLQQGNQFGANRQNPSAGMAFQTGGMLPHQYIQPSMSSATGQSGQSGYPQQSISRAPTLTGTSDGTSAPVDNSQLTFRSSIVLYMSCDDESLSEYQCLVRKHIELFEAGHIDVESNAQGRNKPIVMGQVGIRCRHCTMLPPKNRSRGAMYYPAKVSNACDSPVTFVLSSCA
jgi:hypothetical protein